MDFKKFFVTHDVKFFEDIFPYLDENFTTIEPDPVALPYGSAGPVSSPHADSSTHVVSSSSSNDTVIYRALGDDALELGRGHGEKFPSVKFRDFVTHTTIKKSSSLASPTLEPSLRVEPQSLKEAMKNAGWRSAMQKEIRALEDNDTWFIETLPPEKKVLGSKWVYKIKYNSDGSIERFKANLIVFGNHQVEGIDYNETFAPVAKIVIVRAFLAIAASKN
ncbi:uncharacterized mitochondrial protein AtMg00820-like [Gossypium hirsutum]|uniref:Uncharacterized mitochondrial protein AtMg00820-like n=1 Tax=Gossypium hirsutum TaxID=3635 RepID=A0A1U8PMN6_GOSHI|nr:uncharacterized mitochondrial protein AtMg00820-like [Gossypium hirsutum]